MGGNGTSVGSRAFGGIERGVRHAERAEDFALAEGVERFVGESLQGDAENDEADVAVFGASAGIGGEFGGEGGREQFVASLGAQEELLVGRQSGGVRQQHAQSDFVAAGDRRAANSGTMAVTGASRSSRPRS